MVLIFTTVRDSAPPENDFSWTDLKSPPEKAKASFEILKKLMSNEGHDLDIQLPNELDTDTFVNIGLYKDEILEAWDLIHTWRDYVRQLNSFDGIADLTKPDDDFFCFSKLRQIANTYCAYAVLQTKRGNPEEGIRALNEIHSLARKALPYSRYLIHNIIWTAIAKNNIRVASVIASSSECRNDDLVLMKDYFRPFFKYDKPFSNMFISEYLFMLNAFKQEIEFTVESDLFALYLHGRLGEQTEVVDCFSGKNYLEGKTPNQYFSVGIDGLPGTTDDISLEKWLL